MRERGKKKFGRNKLHFCQVARQASLSGTICQAGFIIIYGEDCGQEDRRWFMLKEMFVLNIAGVAEHSTLVEIEIG